MTRAAKLQSFVEGLRDKPVAWGEDDCCAWVRRWIDIATGIAIETPAYASRHDAHRIIAAAGGLPALWCDLAARHGFAPTGAPALGDVALVEMSFGPAGVIFGHGGICYARLDRGVKPMKPRAFIAAWVVP